VFLVTLWLSARISPEAVWGFAESCIKKWLHEYKD